MTRKYKQYNNVSEMVHDLSDPEYAKEFDKRMRDFTKLDILIDRLGPVSIVEQLLFRMTTAEFLDDENEGLRQRLMEVLKYDE